MSLAQAALRMTRRCDLISHCDGAVALLDGAARVFVQSWISVMPRAVRGAHVVREGALSHGCTKEKDLPVARRHAPQPSGAAARGACRMRQLRRAEAAAPRMQPLRPLRRARSGRGRQAAAGRCPGLRPGRGVLSGSPVTGPFTLAVDAMGGDNAPDMVVHGLELAAERHPAARFLLIGNEPALTALLAATSAPARPAPCGMRPMSSATT